MTIESGSTCVPNSILRDARVSPPSRLLYSILKSYAWQTDNSFPGQKRLADEMGCSDRMVRVYLQELEDCGLITVEQRGKTATNRYFLTDQINSEWKPTSASDRKHTSTHNESDRKPVSTVTGSTVPLVTGSTLPTNKTQGNKTQINKTQSPPTPQVAEDAKQMRLKLRTLFPPNQQMAISSATNSKLHEVTDNHPLDWVREAFDITATAGRNLCYLIAILDHWKRHEHLCKCGNPTGEKPVVVIPGQPRQKTQDEIDREKDMARWTEKRKAQMARWDEVTTNRQLANQA
jgi:biotin operon repressor